MATGDGVDDIESVDEPSEPTEGTQGAFSLEQEPPLEDVAVEGLPPVDEVREPKKSRLSRRWRRNSFDDLPDEDTSLLEGIESAEVATQQYDGLAEAVRAADAAGPVDQTLSVHVDGVAAGVVGFDDMTDEDLDTGVHAAVVEDDEQTAEIKAEIAQQTKKRKQFQQRVITGLSLVAVAGLAVWAGPGWFVAFVGALMFVAVGEFYGASRKGGYTPMALVGLVGTILVFVFGWKLGAYGIAATVGLSLVVLMLYYAIVPRQLPFENLSVTALGLIWVGALGAFVAPLVEAAAWQQLLALIVLIVAAGDSGAFLIGRWLGRTKFAPTLSPNKTVEGLIGGTAMTFIVAVGLASAPWFSDAITMKIALWTAGVAAIAAPFGDLIESMVKRSIGVKDMGTILPGHGGILDRVDSFLIVLPSVYAAYLWLGLLG